MNFIIKKCLKCGALVEVMKDCNCENCGIKCCGDSMVELKPNTFEASAEKHLPIYKINGNEIIASVPHVMEQEHYIEWLALVSADGVEKKYFKPGDSTEVIFPYIKGSKIYAYCNKHSLWETVVK